jgi:hypothetical protein
MIHPTIALRSVLRQTNEFRIELEIWACEALRGPNYLNPKRNGQLSSIFWQLGAFDKELSRFMSRPGTFYNMDVEGLKRAVDAALGEGAYPEYKALNGAANVKAKTLLLAIRNYQDALGSAVTVCNVCKDTYSAAEVNADGKCAGCARRARDRQRNREADAN